MAYTALAVGPVSRDGLTSTFVAAPGIGAGNGSSFANNGTRLLRFKNASGGAVVATVLIGSTVDGRIVAGRPVSIPATTGDVIAGPWPTSSYNQPDGTVLVDFAAVTGVTVAVVDVAAS